MNIDRYIIITSINQPTNSVKSFSSLENYSVVVVGDKKTPENWLCDNAEFLCVRKQQELNFQITDHLPYNHYSRKNIGYLYAIKYHGEIIIDTDDDNIPKSNWDFPDRIGKYKLTKPDSGFVNVYKYFTDANIWPRGFPLNLIKRNYDFEDVSSDAVNVPIWQALADGDPDVDAVYRLIFDDECVFNPNDPIVLNKGTICPFNSQNTLFHKDVFHLLYLPSTVSFRFTDILRGLISQPILWLYDWHLGFSAATVEQLRNPHDYMKDFASEVPCYLNCEKIVELISPVLTSSKTIADNLYNAYDKLCSSHIVGSDEMVILDAWINDVKS